jgi:DNA-binding winged helix-turn-helix (wHTH) protein
LASPDNSVPGAGDARLYRFSIFEADVRTGELRRRGIRVRLQDQPFQVLTALLARPKELVTREELFNRIWGDDVHVDWDHGLNTSINRLREVLGDNAATPRFIETLPRRGYRFLADVEVVQPAADAAEIARMAPAPSEPATTPNSSAALTRTWFLLAQIMYMGFYIAALINMDEITGLLEAVFAGFTKAVALLLFVTAMIGIPVRFFLITAHTFRYSKFREKYDRLFPGLLILDELWGLSPLLMAPRIGIGLSLVVVAALLYLPFGQRTLVQMFSGEKL